MILSDRDILECLASGHLKIEGCRGVGPASVDVYLGTSFVMRDESYNLRNSRHCFQLPPGWFALATTQEIVTLPDDIMAQVHGCSSIGRNGLFVQNAGLIDPGFNGEITLELFNASHRVIDLYPGDRIAQLSFSYLHTTCKTPYGVKGRYQGQRGATTARPPR